MLARQTVAVREVSRTVLHDGVNGMKNLEGKSMKEDVTRNTFKKLEELHLPSLLQKVCGHMNVKDATIRSTHSQIDALITEQWVTFDLDHPDNKDFVHRTAGMWQLRSFRARGLTQAPTIFSHPSRCRCEDSSRSCSTGHTATQDWSEKLGLLGRRKRFEVPFAVAKVENVDWCTPVADWGQGSTSVTADPVRAETTAKEC